MIISRAGDGDTPQPTENPCYVGGNPGPTRPLCQEFWTPSSPTMENDSPPRSVPRLLLLSQRSTVETSSTFPVTGETTAQPLAAKMSVAL
jgi:hypothetical protein